MDATREYCLIAEAPAAPVRGPHASPNELLRLMVPPGESCLTLSADGRPIVSARTAETEGRGLTLELLRHAHQMQLLLVSPSAGLVRVNAAPAPRLAVLHEKDQVTLGAEGLVLHVSQFVRPFIGPAPQELVGSTCVLCQVPIEANALVYVCPFCLGAMHLETEADKDPEERLECAASVTQCPMCLKPVVEQAGLTYDPREENVA
jgi:hypothetical protein